MVVFFIYNLLATGIFMQVQDLSRFLDICHLAERLKSELRHSWLSCGRQESVAEHSWRLTLMCVLLQPHLDPSVDIAKVMKMALIHDLVEAEAGDMPAFDIDENGAQQKRMRERQAINNIQQTLSNTVGDEIAFLWHEFEAGESYAAKLVLALDKLECKLQHLEADLSTWNETEKTCCFEWQDELYDFEPAILQLRDHLLELSQQKCAVES